MDNRFHFLAEVPRERVVSDVEIVRGALFFFCDWPQCETAESSRLETMLL